MDAPSPVEAQEEQEHSESESLPQFKVAGNRLAYKHLRRSPGADGKFSRLRVGVFLLWVCIIIIFQTVFLIGSMLRIMRSIDVSLARLDNRIDELTQIAPEQPSIGSINPDNLPSHIAVTDEPQAIELGFRIVTQDNQNVADGTVVRFEAFDGQIDPVTTTRDGMAYTRFRPTSNSGDVMIVVGVGGVESAFSIALTPPPTLDRIELDPDRTRLRADGRDTAQIIIRAIDNHGNPMENVAITLRVEPAGSGSLSANEITIAGEGTVSFTAGAQEGHPTIIAEAQDGSGINSRLELELVNNMTELTVTPSETEFWNSGDDEVRLGIILKDGLGNSMPDRLVTLEITGAAEAWFLGDDEQPILDSFVTTRNTDENGATEAWCRLGETPGEVVIVVRAEEQEERVTLTIGELGPSVVEIQADPTELLIDEQSNLSITVRDQRGTPVPDISVTLTMEPAGMGEIASELVTGEDGSAPVIFTARSAGQTTIAVAMNESISESIILTIIEGGDEDGDGRSDSRERELGTDPAIADDKVAIEGPLGGTWALRPIFHVPAGVVLDRVDRNSPQDSQTVRLQVWVKMDDLNWIGDEQRTLKEGARISLAQEGFDQLLLGVGLVIEGYTVRIVEGQVRDDWQLAEIEGYFPIENLDRP